jgi:cytochrome b
VNAAAIMRLIWDLPTRLFHWTLVLLIALQYATAKFHFLDMDWHFRFGYATLTLIIFRVCWGFFGSKSSRFTHFVRGPVAVVRYVRSQFSTNPQVSIGHNPLGGWSAIVLIVSVLTQAISGLFASDGVDTDGPLSDKVSSSTVKILTRVHLWNENILLILIALHVVAIALYFVLRHDDLLTPMITGRKVIVGQPIVFASLWRALLLLIISASAVTGLIVWATR